MDVRIKNILGQKYGRLTVIGVSGRGHSRCVLWSCQCECGAITAATGTSLKNGHKRSCGCLRLELSSENMRRVATKHGKKNTLAYKSWEGMIQRCTNPKNHKYPNYGGRGISVCDKWRSFEAFYEDVGPRPGKEYSIERNDNDGDYEPGNCTWALPGEQAKNKRVSVLSKTGIAGVYWKTQANKYQARISVDGKRISLGYYDSIEHAASIRREAELRLWGRAKPGRAFQQ